MMGQHAEDTIQAGLDAYEFYGDYDFGGFVGCRPINCRYCGKGPFFWTETSKGWRLVDEEDELHLCRDYSPPSSDPNDDFEVLDGQGNPMKTRQYIGRV